MRFLIISLCVILMSGFSVQAEGFQFKDLSGKIHTLSEYRGKWVLINFWATWCPPCLEEIPDLISIHESREDVMVIGIAMDYSDPAVVVDFVESMGISYPTVLGDRRIAAQIEDISMLPSTYLFDPAGKPAARKLGLITRETIEEFIKEKAADFIKNNRP